MMKGNLHRFYIPPENITGKTVVFPAEHENHIKNVLRMKPGEYCVIFDGTGREYEVCLEKIYPEPEGKIVSGPVDCAKDRILITLVQGLAKGDKMDQIIRKNSEIGIDRFIPCRCDRCIVKLDKANATGKQERWQKIAQSAAEQSHGMTIPIVAPVTDLDSVLGQIRPEQLAIIPWEQEKATGIKEILHGNTAKDIIFFIGPEGGFSEREIAAAKKAGVIPVSLGRHILRTETAGIVVSSILHYELD